MKKVLTALIVFVTALSIFGLKTQAAGTGNLVIHFHNWSGEYENMAAWVWGTPSYHEVWHPAESTTDEFGVQFKLNDIPVSGEGDIGFISASHPTATADWGTAVKQTNNVVIPISNVKDGKTVHVYVFQGAETKEDQPGFFVANPDKQNVLVVYYDAANAYSEDLGIHGWGWDGVAGSSAWGTPTKVLTNAGVAESGYPVKGFMLSSGAVGAGFLMYAGDDATKKTGDLKPDTGWFETNTPGSTEVLYIVNAGDAVTDNSNVYTDAALFAEEAFSFKLSAYDPSDMSGTFAKNPTDIYVSTSASVASPYPAAADKEAARAVIESWFTVKEKTGENTYGAALQIERVDFALSATTLNTFVVVLKDTNKLDNTKEYEVFFDLGLPETPPAPLDEDKVVAVTLNLTAPANTPTDAVLGVAGSFNGWANGSAGYTATKVGDIYTVTFNVSVKNPFTSFEYKWTRGDWPNAEFIESNRPLVIPNDVDAITFEDVVLAWEDIDAPENKYAAPVRVAPEFVPNVKASLVLDMDKEAPVLTFISPSGIVGKPAAERVIEVAWGKTFDQNLFPGYRVVDNRDGDLTTLVYVPKGTQSKLDTSKVGDYTIMLKVEDKWGNVTQETFIFRVVKK